IGAKGPRCPSLLTSPFCQMLTCILAVFSLLAASTSCRRTSITPSLCLLVSMASHSDCAVGDLIGRTIKEVSVKKKHCSRSYRQTRLSPGQESNVKTDTVKKKLKKQENKSGIS
uniref:Uncharacterized protein n=1 Tax=Lates calcarifer TaxID=8187 RepID=A0A4W6CI71_LATCA